MSAAVCLLDNYRRRSIVHRQGPLFAMLELFWCSIGPGGRLELLKEATIAAGCLVVSPLSLIFPNNGLNHHLPCNTGGIRREAAQSQQHPTERGPKEPSHPPDPSAPHPAHFTCKYYLR